MGSKRSAGYTLIELLTTLVVAAILLGLAYPRLDGEISRMRTGGALQQLTMDLHYARMLAVRSGRAVVLRPRPSTGCTAGTGRTLIGTYDVVIEGAKPSVVKQVVLGGGRPGLCVEMNGQSVAFNSRGLVRGFNNRTVWARHGRARDSLTVSVVGRIYRRR